MASQCQKDITRQEQKDRQLAILIQQQETMAARQLGAHGTNSGHQFTQADHDLDLAIRDSLLHSSGQLKKDRTVKNSQLGDIETDGPPATQTPHPDPQLTYSQVKGQPMAMRSSRRERRFHVSDSDESHHQGACTDDDITWQHTPEDDASYNVSDDEEEDTNEYRDNVPSEFNENTLSNDGEEISPEVQGASSVVSERRRSLQNEEEEEISREIEELLKVGTISSLEAETIQNRQQRRFRLNNMTKWERNHENEELQPFSFDTDGIPINWTDDSTNQGTGHSMDVRLVELRPGQMEYDKIEDEFKETGIKINKIERIQNTYLLERFKSEMEDTARRRHSGFDLNIRYLYHGTKADKSRICEEGLDQRLSRMGYFGKGIYFSDNPLKCVHYTENMENLGDAYILKCRVILGDSKCFPEGQYDTALKREPEKENVRPGMWRFYDSVVGCPRDYNEFVVYENRRAMIEYIISFKLGPEGTAAMQQLNTPSASTAGATDKEGEPADDNHLDRIREVREAVRRKRCQDRGIIYKEPNQQRIQKDDKMWNKLQMLNGVKPEAVNSGKIIPGASATEQSSISEEIKINNTSLNPEPTSFRTSHRRAGSGGDNYEQELDPVEQVMSGLLQEFLGVTDTDDVEMAKYYITTNQMNINNALMNYYNDLP